MVAEGEHAFDFVEALESDVFFAGGSAEAHAFKGRMTTLIHRGVGCIAGTKLVDDVDGLGGHSQLRHERVKLNELTPVHAGACDEVVKLHSEHDFLVGVQLGGELLGHRPEVVLLLQGVSEKLAEFGVNGLGKVVS